MNRAAWVPVIVLGVLVFVLALEGGDTNLSAIATEASVTVQSSTGNDAVLPAASSSQAGVVTAADYRRIGVGANLPTGSEIRDRLRWRVIGGAGGWVAIGPLTIYYLAITAGSGYEAQVIPAVTAGLASSGSQVNGTVGGHTYYLNKGYVHSNFSGLAAGDWAVYVLAPASEGYVDDFSIEALGSVQTSEVVDNVLQINGEVYDGRRAVITSSDTFTVSTTYTTPAQTYQVGPVTGGPPAPPTPTARACIWISATAGDPGAEPGEALCSDAGATQTWSSAELLAEFVSWTTDSYFYVVQLETVNDLTALRLVGGSNQLAAFTKGTYTLGGMEYEFWRSNNALSSAFRNYAVTLERQ